MKTIVLEGNTQCRLEIANTERVTPRYMTLRELSHYVSILAFLWSVVENGHDRAFLLEDDFNFIPIVDNSVRATFYLTAQVATQLSGILGAPWDDDRSRNSYVKARSRLYEEDILATGVWNKTGRDLAFGALHL